MSARQSLNQCNMLKSALTKPGTAHAKVDHDEYSGSLRGSAVEILTLAEARFRYAKGLLIRLGGDSLGT